MKIVKYVLGTIVIVILWTVSLKVVYNNAATKKHNDEITYTYYLESDTLVKQFWGFPHFQFYLKHIG